MIIRQMKPPLMIAFAALLLSVPLSGMGINQGLGNQPVNPPAGLGLVVRPKGPQAEALFTNNTKKELAIASGKQSRRLKPGQTGTLQFRQQENLQVAEVVPPAKEGGTRSKLLIPPFPIGIGGACGAADPRRGQHPDASIFSQHHGDNHARKRSPPHAFHGGFGWADDQSGHDAPQRRRRRSKVNPRPPMSIEQGSGTTTSLRLPDSKKAWRPPPNSTAFARPRLPTWARSKPPGPSMST